MGGCYPDFMTMGKSRILPTLHLVLLGRFYPLSSSFKLFTISFLMVKQIPVWLPSYTYLINAYNNKQSPFLFVRC